MTRKKLIIAGVIVIVLAGIVYANIAFKRTPGTEINVEKIERRDLEAIVSASGKIQPKKSVSISAETMGKVMNLTVSEGDSVKAGQPLLQIDPRDRRSNRRSPRPKLPGRRCSRRATISNDRTASGNRD